MRYTKSIKFISLLSIIFFAKNCYASDTTNIKLFSQNFSLMLYAEHKNNTVLHQYLGDANILKPNRPLNIGIGFLGEKLGFRISYGFTFLKREEKLDTKYFDFQPHLYGRKVILDAVIQNYKGYHLYKNSESLENTILYENLRTFKLGGLAQYVLNNKKFSYRSAYNRKEQQLKSAGSLLLGLSAYYSKIVFDSDYLPSDFFGGGKLILTNFQIGPNVGYAYNWIIAKKVNIFASITSGINFGFNTKFKNLSFHPTIIPRLSVGYNLESWSFNISYVNDLIYSYLTDNNRIGISSGSLQLSVLRRFYIKNKFYSKINNFIDKLSLQDHVKAKRHKI
ncbi:DUF4421 domain-containing protein [Bacteroidales bacterium OttesenSCG-928-I21]|nr:DUF4421 domain-containing protein [Bacteroidales bacterium OttesenSCG-928-I21]